MSDQENNSPAHSDREEQSEDEVDLVEGSPAEHVPEQEDEEDGEVQFKTKPSSSSAAAKTPAKRFAALAKQDPQSVNYERMFEGMFAAALKFKPSVPKTETKKRKKDCDSDSDSEKASKKEDPKDDLVKQIVTAFQAAAAKPEKKKKSLEREKFDTDSLGTGKFAALVKEENEEVLKESPEGPEINCNWAAIIDKAFRLATMKSKEQDGKVIKALVESYPCPKNTTRLLVPEVEEVMLTLASVLAPNELKYQKLRDEKRKFIQSDIAAAMSAIAPICNLLANRDVDDSDPELSAFSKHLKDALKLLAIAMSKISEERRDSWGRYCSSETLRALKAKVRTGMGDPAFLFGGDISEITKEVETARKTAAALSKSQPQKTKTTYQKQATQSGQQQYQRSSNSRPFRGRGGRGGYNNVQNHQKSYNG